MTGLISKMKSDPVAAHCHSSAHRVELSQSEICGCFYCLAIFAPSEIQEWIDDAPADKDVALTGVTAVCPRCGIDSVVGSASGYPITHEFLSDMHRHWF